MVGETPTRRLTLPILKLKPGSVVSVQSLSDRVYSFTAHWIGGRSYVCAGEQCPVCPEGDTRWIGFLFVRLLHGNQPSRRFLLELSATTYDRAYGLMRMEGEPVWLGQTFEGRRERARSPLVLEPMGVAALDGVKAAEPMRIWEVISTLYSLPTPRAGEVEKEWEERAAVRAAHLLTSASDAVASTI